MDIVRILVAKGVDVDAFAGCGSRRTALEEATSNQHPRMVELLLDLGARFRWSHPNPISLLYDALAGSHSIEIVDMLIKKGIDVNDPSITAICRRTALVYAAERRDLVMVRMLLGAGANVNEMFDGSITALQASVGKDGVDVALALIDAGASIDAPMGDNFAHARASSEQAHKFYHLTTAIQRAALVDNVELVQFLLSEGADINACPWDGCKDKIRSHLTVPWCDVTYCEDHENDEFDYQEVMTALQAAVFNQNATLVRVVLGADADVNARGCGDTPLQLAAAKGDAKICNILLRYGADVNAPADAHYGRTALQAAARTGDCELVQQLLHAGADVNAIASPTGGRTALQAAVEHGSIELVKILIVAGGDINVAASEIAGRTCLQAAAEHSHVELVQLLLGAGAYVNSPAAPRGTSALVAAIKMHDFGIVALLIEAGADVNAHCASTSYIIQDKTGETPLEAAAGRGLVKIATMLLNAGAQVNSHTVGSEFTALGYALRFSRAEMVRLLLDHGADLNACIPNKSPSTPLGVALRGFDINLEIVSALIDAGADFNGTPSIQLAATAGNIQAVQLLLKAGADESAALQDAIKTRDVDLIKFLIEVGADVNAPASPRRGRTALQEAIRIHDINLIKFLIEAGADVNAPASQIWGRTALQEAIRIHDINLIKFLIEAGADVNAPASPIRARTAFQQAARDGTIEVLRLLLAHGADVNAPAAWPGGMTALFGAASRGHLKMVVMLLEAGAHVNAPPSTECELTALDAAAMYGHLDIVVLLLKNDDDAEGIDVRCMRAARLAALHAHPVIARILKEHCTNRESTA
jgi:ankyrin repeat protein